MAKKENKTTMAEAAVTHILAQSGIKSNFEVRCELSDFAKSDSVICKYRRIVKDIFTRVEYLTDIIYMLTDGSLLVSRRLASTHEWLHYHSLKDYQDKENMYNESHYTVEFKQIDV